MAGTITLTYDDGVDGRSLRGGIRKIIADWVSDASDGSASITTVKIVGRLIKAVTNPGSTAPTDNYDIALTDEESNDVLAGCKVTLANRDTTNTEEVYFMVLNSDTAPLSMAIAPVVCDKLTIAITNAGNSKVGRLIIYYQPAG